MLTATARPLAILLAMSELIEQGEQAPGFRLPDEDGNDVSLEDFRGQTVVVYFYPKADTPGCTTQACSIRDRGEEYAAAGATVLGISPDPVKKVKKFHDKQSLNFTLLADADHAVCEAYGVWGEKSMYGRTYWGARRSTFIVGADGVVAHVIPKASPKTHDDEVLAGPRRAVGRLSAQSAQNSFGGGSGVVAAARSAASSFANALRPGGRHERSASACARSRSPDTRSSSQAITQPSALRSASFADFSSSKARSTSFERTPPYLSRSSAATSTAFSSKRTGRGASAAMVGNVFAQRCVAR